MADASRLRQLRRPGLGPPPPPEEARDLSRQAAAPAVALDAVPDAAPAAGEAVRIDGRSLRRSGRTVQFATRVSPEFDRRVRSLAQRQGLLLVEVLERALDAYEHSGNSNKSKI